MKHLPSTSNDLCEKVVMYSEKCLFHNIQLVLFEKSKLCNSNVIF